MAQAAAHAAYVRRLGVSGQRCVGVSSAMGCAPIDLTHVLADAAALETMVRELTAPFADAHVDMVMAIHVDASVGSTETKEGARVRRFVSVVAGAIASTTKTAYGDVAVYRRRRQEAATKQKPVAKKRGRPQKTKQAVVVEATEEEAKPVEKTCHRIVNTYNRATGLSVELRSGVVVNGTRVLLVLDWIDSLDVVLAARDALTEVGADVVGLACVVATSAQLLDELKAKQITFSCSWSPSSGAQLTVLNSDPIAPLCSCEGASDKALSKKRKRPTDEQTIGNLAIEYYTAQYYANAPGEDRSVNMVKPSDPDVRVHAVFDGHGGSIAVEHVASKLCDHIISKVTSESSQDEVKQVLTEAFIACDNDLKQYLESLSPTIRMSKGYCNTGSCGVVALFVGKTIYVANVGDCLAVMGKMDNDGNAKAQELTVEHNCKNATEIRLVLERSRDRNAIRYSKDEQSNGANQGGYGIKRVAGSLAVTRAFGDFYLKCEELSSAPFKSKVPYITVEPSVSVHQIEDDEQYLVLASDGLWEVMEPAEVIKIVHQFDPRQTLFFASCSAALIHATLEKIAHRDGLLLHEIMALSPGSERRRFHDDITCTVIQIKGTREQISTPEMSAVNVIQEDEPAPPVI
ncbi:hypothetical protein Poli38472_014071 [Pythium oligandrum]|uniref:PPM-type phosphatase domain-containing protein n=1 Tax=Pythium oligandrum TaxID=41045 RepID=A0A8K1CNJ7_PYTOL|nr:hypothetical protein Poli38472_014071 [Pythium oligandrum]|eukprot:TMW66759.1 hypothetical protein Poli38472_014071 [Pythium oligandrum]